MSRRQFVSVAAGAMLPLDLWPGLRSRSSLVALLDLKEHCCVRESLVGYETALGSRSIRAHPHAVPRCSALIVPAAVDIPPPAVRAIVSCLQAGASVILESGAGFAAAREFRAHRVMLRDYLQVRIEAPVPLWSARPSSQGIPYVDYSWPYRAKVRDFSRAVPLGRQAGEVIGWVNGLPVALKRRSGRGTLVFLGSPLGPALWTGDAEARRWLFDCLREMGSRPPLLL